MRYSVLFAIACILISPVSAGVDLVKVDKSESKMMLMEKGEVVREFHVALGGHPKGHKRQEGDEKTPEGVYTLDYKNGCIALTNTDMDTFMDLVNVGTRIEIAW